MDLLDQVAKSVSEGTLSDLTERYDYPKPVPGRVVHIDADFLSYQVSAESKAELDPEDPTPRKSKEDMQHNAKVAVEHIMRLAGGTAYHLHTTPSGSTKGGRGEQVVLKEYQANRKDRDNKPEFLDHIRAWLISELGSGGNGTAHLDQEADDGMAQAAWAAHETGQSELCVVASKDKDLLMVPGPKLLDDRVVQAKDLFGQIEIVAKKSGKKLTGLGTKFFWAQCLMGDQADNISGLPEVCGKDWMAVKPTKAYETAIKKLGTGSTFEDQRLEQQITAMLAKRKKCGPAMAFDLLDDCHTDKDCFIRVRNLWTNLEADGYEFTHWRTGQKVKATQALLGDMQALWMRRSKDKKDVVKWIKEFMND